jgi:hypothetical protein
MEKKSQKSPKSKKPREKPLKLDMSFDEALKMLANTPPLRKKKK